MKPDVTDVYGSSQRHTEGLNCPVKVLVIEGIFVVPNPGRRIGDFVAHKPNSVGARNGLDLVHRRACPGVDSRVHSRRRSQRRKGEIGCPANTELTVGGVVILVALRRVSLAPGILLWSDVFRFSEIDRPLIEGCIQITGFHKNPVRYAIVHVVAVVVRVRRKVTCERIDPGTRTDLILVAV